MWKNHFVLVGFSKSKLLIRWKFNGQKSIWDKWFCSVHQRWSIRYNCSAELQISITSPTKKPKKFFYIAIASTLPLPFVICESKDIKPSQAKCNDLIGGKNVWRYAP